MINTVYELITDVMAKQYPDRVAFRYVAADGKTVVEKTYAQYVQDIRRAVTYFKENIPDIKGKRVGIMSRNCYEYGVNSFGAILAGAVVVTINQKKTWPELEYELGLVEPSLIVNDGIDYGCRPDIEAAYGDKLRPMDAFKDSAPAELVDCVGHDDLMVLMFTSGTTGLFHNRQLFAYLCEINGQHRRGQINSHFSFSFRFPVPHKAFCIFHICGCQWLRRSALLRHNPAH